MKKSIRILVLAASTVALSKAAPFMAVGDGAELFATGTIGVRADDNILLAPSGQKISDTIFDFIPGLELDYGKNAQVQGALTLQDDFSKYTSHSKYDTNLFQGDFVGKYDDGKMKLGFNAGYHELNQNTVDVRGLIRRDITSLGANGEAAVSEITAFGAGVQFTHENYHPFNYVDSDTTSIPLNFYYKYTPKVDLSLGYTYRDYSVKNGMAADATDHFFNIGARGEFSPKLTGKFAVGYTERHASSFNGTPSSTHGLLGVDASFAYEVSPKSTVQFGASNDFGTSPTGSQEKNLTLNVLGTTKITEEFSVNGGVSYRAIGYTGTRTTAGRTDDYWEGTIGGAYVVNANLRLVGAYVYRNYSSNIAGSDFNDNVLSFAANIRY
jgi:hypothetical protein